MPATIYDHELPGRRVFEAMGFAIMRRENSRASRKTRMRRFVSWFGAEPVFLAIVWRKLHESGWLEFAGRRPKPVHLLWTFMWLKGYNNEEVHASQAGVDEKTFREKVWFYVEGIARLDTTIVRLVLIAVVAFVACFWSLICHLTLTPNSFFKLNADPVE